MLRSGGRTISQASATGGAVYIGKERVGDVTDHPAFANAARMYAAMYDLKRADDMREVLWVERDGERFPAWFLKPRSRRDLEIRTAAHRAIAGFSHGLLGRSPDHVASSITGLSIGSAVFDRDGGAWSERIDAYYEHAGAREPLPRLRDPAAAGRAQAGALPEHRQEPADPSGNGRGQPGRRPQRDEDAGDRRGVRRRTLDRQHHPARAEPN